MITDRAFEADGALKYPAMDPHLISMPGIDAEHMQGAAGDVILVNGAPWPELEVDAVRYRFRILNASNARRYELALDPPAPLTQIGSDQGLLEALVEHTTIAVAPAERYDVIVDFAAYPVGTKVVLKNGDGKVMRFVVARTATDDSRIPARLSKIEALPRRAATARPWMFRKGTVKIMGEETDGWIINGREFDPQRIGATPRLGDVEIWLLASDAHHPVHIHLSPFQVISRNGGASGPRRPRLEGHRRPAPARVGRGGDPLRRSCRAIPAALPQPRTRGHGDDGHVPGERLNGG
ncbi:multicopper oxidase domain-containing protein [Micromonospora sp. 4G57]|uniref:Multicopper oxidase domain-containing protein n=1 Tax=Micromonospora sicca TaxID=2202420 RepID=A0ABU5JBF1_9ACTN|nr:MULTISPECIES: multicopper oxidase domain-containing protein [unclassified Micromonospora]MDZ5444412.1 multicopper oxidase domain-containing protein [Micromonospora sp. 4G57]MDZ5489754.1 multicopper oxidase domain-containing protein [Micromonospora sp. 4G53]